MTGRLTGWMTDGRMESFISSRRLHGKLHFIPKLHDHDVAGGWTGQMMNEKSFISSRPRQTTTMPIFWTCWLLHHVANREAFRPFFFPSPLLHLGSMWQRVDIYSMESGDSSTNIRVCAIVSLCWLCDGLTRSPRPTGPGMNVYNWAGQNFLWAWQETILDFYEKICVFVLLLLLLWWWWWKVYLWLQVLFVCRGFVLPTCVVVTAMLIF